MEDDTQSKIDGMNYTQTDNENFEYKFLTTDYADHVSINHQTPSGRQKFLVCLGDSRGQVHMNHLYLP